jgi:hypothetical protein
VGASEREGRGERAREAGEAFSDDLFFSAEAMGRSVPYSGVCL